MAEQLVIQGAMIVRPGDIIRLLFTKTGPRRQAADRVDERLEKAQEENRVAVEENESAVRSLIDGLFIRMDHARRPTPSHH